MAIKNNTNKSLSARIKRRNAQGFSGLGTGHAVDKDGNVLCYNTSKLRSGNFGDYRNDEENHKDVDRRNAQRLKDRLGFRPKEYKIMPDGKVMFIGRKLRVMSKRYASNRQRLKG